MSSARSRKPEALLEEVFPPMLATLVDAPPADEASFVLELKYDGIRALSALSAGEVAMWTRNGLDLAGRAPGIARDLATLRARSLVLDGELVAAEDAGEAPRFELLQQRG